MTSPVRVPLRISQSRSGTAASQCRSGVRRRRSGTAGCSASRRRVPPKKEKFLHKSVGNSFFIAIDEGTS